MRYLLMLLLTGCGSTEVIRYVDRPVTVEVPVYTPCEVHMPKVVTYTTDRLTARSTDFEKIQALLIERKERGASEDELRLLLSICTNKGES